MTPDLTRPAHEVAPDLLGCLLTSSGPDGVVTVALTEVEAYSGSEDPASHAFRGRTPRNAVMFGPAGRAYVYRSHGLHWCLNVVTGPEGVASAVLLRAGRVVEGRDVARARRGPGIVERALARGPGCLAQALGLTGADDGARLDGPRLLLSPAPSPVGAIVSGPRVGVTQAPDVALRWWVAGDRTVSTYRRSPRAPAPRPRIAGGTGA